MRHAGRQKAQRCQPLFLLQLALEPHAFRDVADDQDAGAVGDVGGVQWAGSDRDFFLFAVAVDELRFQRSRVRAQQLVVRREELGD